MRGEISLKKTTARSLLSSPSFLLSPFLPPHNHTTTHPTPHMHCSARGASGAGRGWLAPHSLMMMMVIDSLFVRCGPWLSLNASKITNRIQGGSCLTIICLRGRLYECNGMGGIEIHVLITVNQPPTSPSLYRSKGLRLITKDGRDGHPIYRVGSDYGAGHRSPGLLVLIHEVAKEDEGPEDGGACHALPVQAGEAFQRLKAGGSWKGACSGVMR